MLQRPPKIWSKLYPLPRVRRPNNRHNLSAETSSRDPMRQHQSWRKRRVARRFRRHRIAPVKSTCQLRTGCSRSWSVSLLSSSSWSGTASRSSIKNLRDLIQNLTESRMTPRNSMTILKCYPRKSLWSQAWRTWAPRIDRLWLSISGTRRREWMPLESFSIEDHLLICD